MAENTGIKDPFMKEPITAEPSGKVYLPNTLHGKVDQAVNKAKATYRRYFEGADPLIKTKQEEEESLKNRTP